MQMATKYIFILLMMILACTSIHTNSYVGEAKPLNDFKEYAAKPKGTIKTMKWQSGDLVDCVDIYQQPSLNHHFLKNHTIQLEPDSFPPDSLIKRNLSHSNLMGMPENERCPNGSIPIRRPFKDELVRTTFPRSRHENRSKGNDPPNGVHKYAVISQESNGPLLISVSASLNIWKPTTEYMTFSLAQLWAIYHRENVAGEAVETGWMVYPNKFGDRKPRFFIFFTNDGYTSGCYNLDCTGFVQISSEVCLGCGIYPYSTYDGDQFEVELTISQNPFTKVWWIRYHTVVVGYYPATLFPRLSQGGATHVEWGGEVSQLAESTPTLNQMGSGHFPEEGIQKAAFFENPLYEEANWRVYTPVDSQIKKFATHPQCYHLSQVFGESEGRLFKPHFYYGGPGGSSPGCNI